MTGWGDLVERGLARRDVPLAPLTTYKLGGPADLLVDVSSPDAFDDLHAALTRHPRPVLVVGRGSNLLVSDRGFRGVVVRLGPAFGAMDVDGDGVVTAGASLSLPRLARGAGPKGRGGLEWCVGVPGSVGGAVRQNAGCFGSEVKDVLVDAEIVSLDTGRRGTVAAADLDLAYRHSNVAPTDIVTAARFRTVAADPAELAEEMKRVTRWRRDHQPGGTLNAGSVFKNPPGAAAGEIIDGLGLKGFAVGLVRVSPRHGNFFEAAAGARAEDVRALVTAVQELVEERAGVALEPEIQFVGFEG